MLDLVAWRQGDHLLFLSRFLLFNLFVYHFTSDSFLPLLRLLRFPPFLFGVQPVGRTVRYDAVKTCRGWSADIRLSHIRLATLAYRLSPIRLLPIKTLAYFAKYKKRDFSLSGQGQLPIGHWPIRRWPIRLKPISPKPMFTFLLPFSVFET